MRESLSPAFSLISACEDGPPAGLLHHREAGHIRIGNAHTSRAWWLKVLSAGPSVQCLCVSPPRAQPWGSLEMTSISRGSRGGGEENHMVSEEKGLVLPSSLSCPSGTWFPGEEIGDF